MQVEYQRDVVVIMASLLGIVTGHELRKMRTPAPSSGAAIPASDAVGDAAGDSSGEPLIAVSSLFAASTLSLRVGDRLGVPRDKLVAQAVLSFGVAAALTYFTAALRHYIPGLKG